MKINILNYADVSTGSMSIDDLRIFPGLPSFVNSYGLTEHFKILQGG